jgi:hypothetical protein
MLMRMVAGSAECRKNVVRIVHCEVIIMLIATAILERHVCNISIRALHFVKDSLLAFRIDRSRSGYPANLR